MKKLPSHPKNVKGDFYVEDGCCTGCDLPSSKAPDMFEYEDTHCYICKQPKTQEEVVRILSAMSIQDLDCIQYKGKDRNILKSLRENGMESCISSNIQIFIANLKRKLGFK